MASAGPAFLRPVWLLPLVLALGCAPVLPPATVHDRLTIHAWGDAGEREALSSLVESLEEDLGKRLELPVPSSPLEVCVFDSSREMSEYLQRHCPEQSGKAAGCFSRRGGTVVTVVKAKAPRGLERMLRHELTHALLSFHYQELPRWVDEGLAQFLEEDFASAIREGPRRREIEARRPSLAAGRVLELLALPPREPLTREQYLHSWLAVGFLMREERLGLGRMKVFLARVRADGTERSAFESAFGPVDEEFGDLWSSFLAREGLSDGGSGPLPDRRP